MCRCLWEIPRTFGHSVGLNSKKSYFLPCVCICLRIEVGPLTTPTRNGFRPLWRLWRPLVMPSIHPCPRPKPFWDRGAWSWYILSLHGGSPSRNCNFRLVPARTTHALFKYENIGYVEVAGGHLYNTHECIIWMLLFLLFCICSVIYSTPPLRVGI